MHMPQSERLFITCQKSATKNVQIFVMGATLDSASAPWTAQKMTTDFEFKAPEIKKILYRWVPPQRLVGIPPGPEVRLPARD